MLGSLADFDQAVSGLGEAEDSDGDEQLRQRVNIERTGGAHLVAHENPTGRRHQVVQICAELSKALSTLTHLGWAIHLQRLQLLLIERLAHFGAVDKRGAQRRHQQHLVVLLQPPIHVPVAAKTRNLTCLLPLSGAKGRICSTILRLPACRFQRDHAKLKHPEICAML